MEAREEGAARYRATPRCPAAVKVNERPTCISFAGFSARIASNDSALK